MDGSVKNSYIIRIYIVVIEMYKTFFEFYKTREYLDNRHTSFYRCSDMILISIDEAINRQSEFLTFFPLFSLNITGGGLSNIDFCIGPIPLLIYLTLFLLFRSNNLSGPLIITCLVASALMPFFQISLCHFLGTIEKRTAGKSNWHKGFERISYGTGTGYKIV